MKKTIMVLLFASVTMIGFAQEKENYIKDGFFYTKLESGVGEEINVKFSLASDFIEKFSDTEVFKKWKEETYSNPKNAGYIEKWKNQTDIETYLMSKIDMASFYAKLGLKNENSYTPVNGKGFIYVNDKNEVNISFPIKAQNGYGNMIYATAYYSEKMKDGKVDTWHAVSSN